MQSLRRYSLYILVPLTLLGYYLLAQVERSDVLMLIGLFSLLFIGYIGLLKLKTTHLGWILIGLCFRFTFTGYTPLLSQDYFRFIWDGSLLSHGINPYLYLPNELIKIFSEWEYLHSGMGTMSAGHYTNYPMINQLLFALGVLSTKPILTYRLLLILADFVTFKLLTKLSSQTWGLTYWLSPLVILEGVGNLHFEPVMVALLMLGLYYFKQGKHLRSSVALAASVLLKLIPLMFAPLLLKVVKEKQLKIMVFGFSITLALFATPFLDPWFFSTYSESVGLWFSNFEFNAGIYRVVKELGALFGVQDWQMIRFYGKAHSLVILVLALKFTWECDRFSKVLDKSYLLLLIYLLTAPTIHPWYLITLIALGAISKHPSATLWSLTIILSYIAYKMNPIELPLWLVALQFIPVVMSLINFSFRSFLEKKLL
jgi:alpha-1,6-mannosyltransferase